MEFRVFIFELLDCSGYGNLGLRKGNGAGVDRQGDCATRA